MPGSGPVTVGRVTRYLPYLVVGPETGARRTVNLGQEVVMGSARLYRVRRRPSAEGALLTPDCICERDNIRQYRGRGMPRRGPRYFGARRRDRESLSDISTRRITRLTFGSTSCGWSAQNEW